MCEECDEKAAKVQDDEQNATVLLDSLLDIARHAETMEDVSPIAKYDGVREVLAMGVPPFAFPDLLTVAIRRLIDAPLASSYVVGSGDVETAPDVEREPVQVGLYM